MWGPSTRLRLCEVIRAEGYPAIFTTVFSNLHSTTMATSSALAVLFLAHFAHCLASDLTVTAVATLPQEVENWQHADFEPLEQAPLVVGNASLIPHESVAFSPRGLSNPFKKRAGNYCFSSCSSCYCSSGNDCCTNTALQSGWCCWFTLDCDTVNMKCHTPT